MSTFAVSSVVEAIRTIKHPFKTIVVGVLVLLGLMSANLAFGATIFEDSFEEYDLGALSGQGDWLDSDKTLVEDTIKKHEIQAAVLPHYGVGYGTSRIGTSSCVGSIGFWFLVDYTSPSPFNNIYFTLQRSTGGYTMAYIRVNAGTDPYEVRLYYKGAYAVLGSFEEDIWYPVDIEWDCAIKKIRARFNEGEWSDWYTNIQEQSYEIDKVILQHNFFTSNNYADFYIDWIAETSEIPSCSIEHCDLCYNWFDCEIEGCCWYYNPYFIITNYCALCYEECSFETCGSCANQEDCEAVGCYWTGEYCSWIVSECGDGLACQFCETQETCEAEDCFWSTANQTCWYKAPTLPSDWSAYYDEHGGYEVPAGFVDDLAETTGEAFDSISSLFEGFAVSFSNSDALARGSALGQTIPKARGYLKIFGGLFGHIPIGETFVFILIFMLAIGLFRTIRHLIQIVKP